MTAKEVTNKFYDLIKDIPSMIDLDKKGAAKAVAKFQEKWIKKYYV